MTDFRSEFYQDYIEFKDWEAESPIDPTELFELEFRNLGTNQKLNILEVGFGKGEFLDWARLNGHQVSGIEIIPRLVEMAKTRGHNVSQMALQDLEVGHYGVEKFDLIVILDVLEHLYPLEITKLLRTCYRILKPDGQVLARFPNGLSPFGIVQHMKDITHVTILTPDRMEQLGRVTGFKVHKFGNSARPLGQGKKPRWVRVLLYKIRNWIEILIGLLYYGQRIPLDPNMSLILKKNVETSK